MRNPAADAYVVTPSPTIPPIAVEVAIDREITPVLLIQVDEMTARHLAAALSLFGTELAPRVRILRDRLDHALLGRPWSPVRERRLAEVIPGRCLGTSAPTLAGPILGVPTSLGPT